MTPHKNVSLGTHLIRQIVYTHNQLQSTPYPAHTHSGTNATPSLTQNAEVETIANLNSFENRLTRLACFCDTCEFPMPAKVFAASKDGGRPRTLPLTPLTTLLSPASLLAALLWLAVLCVVLFKIENCEWYKTQNENAKRNSVGKRKNGKTANGKRKRFLIVMANPPAPSLPALPACLDVSWKRDAACTCRQPQGVCSGCVCV